MAKKTECNPELLPTPRKGDIVYFHSGASFATGKEQAMIVTDIFQPGIITGKVFTPGATYDRVVNCVRYKEHPDVLRRTPGAVAEGAWSFRDEIPEYAYDLALEREEYKEKQREAIVQGGSRSGKTVKAGEKEASSV